MVSVPADSRPPPQLSRFRPYRLALLPVAAAAAYLTWCVLRAELAGRGPTLWVHNTVLFVLATTVILLWPRHTADINRLARELRGLARRIECIREEDVLPGQVQHSFAERVIQGQLQRIDEEIRAVPRMVADSVEAAFRKGMAAGVAAADEDDLREERTLPHLVPVLPRSRRS